MQQIKLGVKQVTTRFDGWKTYIVLALAFLFVVAQAAGWLGEAVGQLTMPQLTERIFAILAIAGIRHGIPKKTN